MKRGIDHLVLPVRDLEAAAARFQALGFTTTPRAQHPWGTANILVQLQGNFLEVLTVVDPHGIQDPASGSFSFGAFCRDFLAQDEGFAMLVFESEDAEADRLDFATKGLQGYAPFDFERQAKLPDGGSATVAFSLSFVTDPRMPDIAFFCCQQHAPQYFWKPQYQRHANGAQVCSAVFMSAAEPAALADFFTGLQGPGAVNTVEGGLAVQTDRGRIIVLTPEALRSRLPMAPAMDPDATPRFVGYQIATADLTGTAAILDEAGIDYRPAGEALQVGPEALFGCCLEFVPAD